MIDVVENSPQIEKILWEISYKKGTLHVAVKNLMGH